ncbi:hypothetical protein [Sansalvadorimonas verongulae]|uniref:hypothetical protein n=1 Tax=Sansalvadorimonas verongulae TaxID=2172824 RepID=UPI0012BC68D0|nr:hypothetical protein [Sansalvadorimonas verongulae]MTI13029.1 hypothetical protein [Sansalvadorimonas verongulae]
MAARPVPARQKNISESSDHGSVTPLATESGRRIFFYPSVLEDEPVFSYPNSSVMKVLRDGHSKECRWLLERGQKAAEAAGSKLQLPVDTVLSTTRPRSDEDLHLLQSLKPLIQQKKFPAPEKIYTSFDVDGIFPENGEFFIPMDCDVLVDQRDPLPSKEELKKLSKSPTVCTLIPRQFNPDLNEGLDTEFRVALNSTKVVLQLKLDDDTCLPFYNSHYHMSGDHADPADEYAAAATIGQYIDQFAPGAQTAIQLLVNEELFNELARNYQDAYNINLDCSGKPGTGSEIKITFMGDGELRVDAKVAYDRYKSTNDRKTKRGFIELALALDLKKDGEMWVPGWTNCSYNMTTKRSYKTMRKQSGLSSGSSSGGSSRQSLLASKSRGLGRSLDILSRSISGLHKLGKHSGSVDIEFEDPTEGAADDFLPFTYRHSHSLTDVLESHLLKPDPSGIAHARVHSDDMSLRPFEGLLSVPATSHQLSSSPSLGTSEDLSTSSEASPFTSLEAEACQWQVSEGSYEKSQVFVVNYKNGWCYTNLAPAEAIYRVFMGGEMRSWMTVEHSVNEPHDMAKMLYQMGLKPPFAHYFSGVPAKVMRGVEGLIVTGDSQELDVDPVIVKNLQEDYTQAWFTALDHFDQRLKHYKPEEEVAKPTMAGLPAKQAEALQKFLDKIESSRKEFATLSDKLDRMTKLGENSFDSYKKLVHKLVSIKVQLNQLNSLGRAGDHTQGDKPLYAQLQEEAGVTSGSHLEPYVKVCLLQLNALNLLCSVKLDVALGRLSLKKVAGYEDLLETVRGKVVSVQSLTEQGAMDVLQDIWEEYLDNTPNLRVAAADDSSRPLPPGMKVTEDGIEYSDV